MDFGLIFRIHWSLFANKTANIFTRNIFVHFGQGFNRRLNGFYL